MPDDVVLPLRELLLMDEDIRRQLRDRRAFLWRTGLAAHPQRCPADGAALLWALTEDPKDPKWLPLNATPTRAGAVAIYRDGGARIARVNPPADVPGGRWDTHFATCADPGRWRRPRH
ncbi:hypothetical protein [Parafrankia discariae]|uniref:hypothetical protein n=1 Tax=Parafrankia discariae TaxID=365528 RepID=UPI0003A230A8|nr:hypothetical protein [Parafrankia discariae]